MPAAVACARLLAVLDVGLRVAALSLAKDAPTRDRPTHLWEAREYDLEAGCEPSARQGTALIFQRHFEESWAGKVEHAFRRIDGPVYMVVGDGRSSLLLRNWFMFAEKVAADEHTTISVVSVSLDAKGFDACRGMVAGLKGVAVECLDLSGWLPEEFFTTAAQKDNEKGGASVGSCAYNFIIWTKPVILRAALRATAHGVLMIDTDVVMYKNLLPYAARAMRENATVTVVTGREYRFTGNFWGANTGTVYVQQDRSQDRMDEWVTRDAETLNDEHGDQAAFHLMFKSKWYRYRKWHEERDSNGHKVRTSEWLPGMHKQLLKIPNEIVGQCAEKGEYATHYNCYTNKLGTMKRKGAWDSRLDEADAGGAGKKLGRVVSGTWGRLADTPSKVAAMRANGDWLIDDEAPPQ